MQRPHLPTHNQSLCIRAPSSQWRVLHTTQCFCYGAVTCCPKFISSFHVWFRGQDAASEAHHSRNTHVGSNAARPKKELSIWTTFFIFDPWIKNVTSFSTKTTFRTSMTTRRPKFKRKSFGL